MSKFTLGIEMTDKAIKVVEISKRKNNYRFKFRVEELPDQTVENGRILNAAMVSKTLGTMLAKMKPKTKKAHFIIPSQSVMVRFLKLPDLPVKELRRIVDFEVRHNIHLPFDKPHYDFIKLANTHAPLHPIKKEVRTKRESRQVFLEAAPALEELSSLQPPSKGQTKPECDVMLVATSYELINEYVQTFQAARIKPLSIEFKALSLYRLIDIFQIANPDETLLIVDMNENVSDLSIFDNGQLKITRSIPLDYSQGNFDKTCSDLAHELDHLMNFYRYTLNNRTEDFEHIILSGDVDRLADIVQFLQNNLSEKVSLLKSDRLPLEQAAEVELFASLAVPIGLALRGD